MITFFNDSTLLIEISHHRSESFIPMIYLNFHYSESIQFVDLILLVQEKKLSFFILVRYNYQLMNMNIIHME